MKLKLLECVTAFTAILTIDKQPTDFKSAYAIMKMKNALSENVSFYERKEREIVENYSDGVEEDGRYTVQPNKVKAFMEKRGELAEMEIEIDREREKIAPPKEITPAAIEALMLVFDLEAEA